MQLAMPEDTAKRRPPTYCLKCGYRLEGLPAVHVCPECGLEYDPCSVLIWLGGKSNAGQNAIGAIAIVAILVWTDLSSDRSFLESLPCVIPLLLLAWFYGRRWFRGVETGRHLVISHRGIRFTHPDLKPRLITWDEFGSARVRWVTARFRISDRRGKKILGCLYYQLGSYWRIREVVAQLNHLAGVYSRPDWREPPSHPTAGEHSVRQW